MKLLGLLCNVYSLDSINYINCMPKFKKRLDLEGDNSLVVIIDILDRNPLRIINLYRSFNAIGVSAGANLRQQLFIIESEYCMYSTI